MRTALVLTYTLVLAAALRAETLANGLAFRTPDGWTAKTNGQAALLAPPDLAMEPGGKNPSELYLIMALPAVKDLKDPQVASILGGQYFPAQAQVQSAGPAEPFHAASGNGYLHRLTAVSQGVALAVDIYVVEIQGGGVAGVMAIGRPALLARREALIRAVAASLSRQAPAMGAVPTTAAGTLAAEWDQRLRGKKLYQFSAYSSSPGSGGYNSQKTLFLAASGAYEFKRSGSASINVSGASGTSASQSGAQGQWRIYEKSGNAILELTATNGSSETIVLTSNSGKTLLNGQRWLVGN